jgi:hypothetical protein
VGEYGASAAGIGDIEEGVVEGQWRETWVEVMKWRRGILFALLMIAFPSKDRRCLFCLEEDYLIFPMTMYR